jgi:hypothetical protein
MVHEYRAILAAMAVFYHNVHGATVVDYGWLTGSSIGTFGQANKAVELDPLLSRLDQ